MKVLCLMSKLMMKNFSVNFHNAHNQLISLFRLYFLAIAEIESGAKCSHDDGRYQMPPFSIS